MSGPFTDVSRCGSSRDMAIAAPQIGIDRTPAATAVLRLRAAGVPPVAGGAARRHVRWSPDSLRYINERQGRISAPAHAAVAWDAGLCRRSQLEAGQHAFRRVPCRSMGISGARHGDRRDRDYAGAAMQGGTESLGGSGRAITRLAALAGFAPRPLVLDLADQFSPHLGEGMIKVALVRTGHEVRPSR